MQNKLILVIAILSTSFILANCSDSSPVNANNAIIQPQDSAMVRAKKNYSNYCASCHYDDLSWFKARKWKYGHSENDIYTSIKTGYTDFGMLSYSKTFTEKEMRDLAKYVHTTLAPGATEKALAMQNKGFFVTEKVKLRPDTIARGLKVPWGMAFLPDGDVLVTEREGKLLRFRNGVQIAEIKGLPDIRAVGQGGLMDIKLHPDYERNGWVYFAYNSPANGSNQSDWKLVRWIKKIAAKLFSADVTGWNTAIMRARIKNNTLVDKKLLFKATPNSEAGHHFGCKITFDGKGHFFFSVGERGKMENAQDLSNDCGKIHRLNDDGSIPNDNPFVNTKGARPSIWSYGHRNPQGLTFNSVTGKLWETEHGPKGGDELNLVVPGKNYGWPLISFGINYDGTIITRDTAKAGLEQPVTYWVPSIAPCGTTFVTGNKYKGWEGNVLVGSLRFRNLVRCELVNDKVVHKETLLLDIGRMRNVEISADGYVHVAVESPGMVIKLVPIE